MVRMSGVTGVAPMGQTDRDYQGEIRLHLYCAPLTATKSVCLQSMDPKHAGNICNLCLLRNGNGSTDTFM